MKTYLLAIVTAALFASGCSSKKNEPKPAADSTNANSYLPVAPGNTWTYNDAVPSYGTSIETTKMVGGTLAINSKNYYTQQNDSPVNGITTNYFYADNHTYAVRTSNYPTSLAIELILGNDSYPVGYSWTTTPTDDGILFGYPTHTVNTIKEKNIPVTVNGKTFVNVIHTQVSFEQDAGGGFKSKGTYDFYLAKGIGLIEKITQLSFQPYEKETLIDYTVK
ncbi:hypothetical protein [Mucilaginibacter sp. OK098]|uniref:hypothetical protein n=1 Tax=Mucilaginibacter sp. OK098 TaxID=1855297 RepID=UPI000918EF78|nr:hypothetical protein [Mucilaginibacter sp. OK098]SHN31771.1 hypothetical protein SAMN05216524_109211 [Mucilaginibacter sp. OK098]